MVSQDSHSTSHCDPASEAEETASKEQLACYAKAVKLLSLRPHFEAQLERKLLDRDFGHEDVAFAVAELKQAGFLDDREFTGRYVCSAVERKGHGPRKVRAYLEAQGVGSSIIDEALAEYFPDREREFADKAASKWRATSSGKPDALARHLDRRGFSGASIRQQVEQQRQRLDSGSFDE